MRLKDRVAIVTGAARGIGRAIALRFAREGADICMVDIDHMDELEKTAEGCRSQGRRVLKLKVDVSRVPELEAMVAKTSEELGGIDILVNNAGIRVHKLIDDVTEEDYDRLMAVNLKAAYFGSKLVIPHMERRGGGKIIHIASQFGHVGAARSSIYCAAKGGLVNLTRVMAVELAGRGINVNTVSPGPIATEFLLARFEREPGGREERLTKVPCGRLGTPEEVADAALFLASDEASYIHGHSLVVDGGFITH